MKRLLPILVCISALGACSTRSSAPTEEADSQVATQVSIFSSKENQKEWILSAESVNFENMQSATLKKPQLLLKQNGKDSAIVSGNMGTFDYATQLVTIDGNATLESVTQKARLSASQFFYSIETNRIWSDTKTIITRGTARSVALNGVETDAKLTKIVIKKHATQLPLDRKELTRDPR